MNAMTCDELLDLLLDFLEGEMEAARKAACEEHLCGCRSCVVYVETYRATITVTRALPACDEGLPPGFEAKLRALLAAERFG